MGATDIPHALPVGEDHCCMETAEACGPHNGPRPCLYAEVPSKARETDGQGIPGRYCQRIPMHHGVKNILTTYVYINMYT